MRGRLQQGHPRACSHWSSRCPRCVRARVCAAGWQGGAEWGPRALLCLVVGASCSCVGHDQPRCRCHGSRAAATGTCSVQCSVQCGARRTGFHEAGALAPARPQGYPAQGVLPGVSWAGPALPPGTGGGPGLLAHLEAVARDTVEGMACGCVYQARVVLRACGAACVRVRAVHAVHTWAVAASRTPAHWW